ncbi:MAG TPA: ethanolamine ammonia lyase-activating protein [Candidatus Binatia bacterium]
MAEITPYIKPPRAESIDSYRLWQDTQKIPRIGGFYVEDIKKIEVAPWELKGGLGAFINLEGTGGINDAYVCVIPAGQKLKPQRHLYEEMVYIVEGSGATSVWLDSGKKQTFEWQAGSFFAIPLNAHYQHHNGSGRDAVRYFAVTSAPLYINLFHNLDFIFDNPFAFRDRFDPNDDDYFSRDGKVWGPRNTMINFIADVNTYELISWKPRGAGGLSMHFDLAAQSMAAHISQFPVGSYKKAHRHGPGAHVTILSGEGYTLLWQEGKDRIRVDWKPGTVVVPPCGWFHQHFNSGAVPVRYLALRKGGNGRYKYPINFNDGEGPGVSLKEGGGQIEYEDEDPEIHREFEAALTNAGAQCAMGAYHPRCGLANGM